MRFKFWLFLFVLVLVGYLARRVQKRKKENLLEAELDRSFIDIKALSEAEEAVRQTTIEEVSGWKVAGRYDSSQGYNENDLMGLVSFLGSYGIPATFTTSGVGIEGGALNTFVLKVPEEELENAQKKLLEY